MDNKNRRDKRLQCDKRFLNFRFSLVAVAPLWFFGVFDTFAVSSNKSLARADVCAYLFIYTKNLMLFLLNCAETAMQMASEKPFNSNWIIIHNDSTHTNTIWYVQSFWPSFVVRLGAAALHPNRIVTVIVEKCCSKNTAKFYESFIALHTRYVEFINTLDSEAHTACSMHGDADGLLLYGNQFVSLAEAQLSVKFIYYILNKFFNASTLFSSAQAVHVHRQTPATIKYFVLRCLESRNEKTVFSENNYRPVLWIRWSFIWSICISWGR